MDFNANLDGNSIIEEAIAQFNSKRTKENMVAVLEAIRRRMHEDGQFILPVIPPQAAFDAIDLEHIKAGDTITYDEDLHFKLHHIETDEGGPAWLYSPVVKSAKKAKVSLRLRTLSLRY